MKAKEEGERSTKVGRKRGRPKKSTNKEGSSKKPLAKRPRKGAAYPAIDNEESSEWVEEGSESCSGSDIEDAFCEEQDTTAKTERTRRLLKRANEGRARECNQIDYRAAR